MAAPLFNDPVSAVGKYVGTKSVEDFQHNTGTMFCHNGMEISEMVT
jgi:hypothetical protein